MITSATQKQKERPFPWQCFRCGKREVVAAATNFEIEVRHDHRLYALTIPNLRVPTCQACGEKVFTIDTDKQINAALRAHLGLLAPAQIREGIERLGMTPKEIAEHTGIAEETLSRWMDELQIQSRAMDNFLRVYFDVPQVRSRLAGSENCANIVSSQPKRMRVIQLGD